MAAVAPIFVNEFMYKDRSCYEALAWSLVSLLPTTFYRVVYIRAGGGFGVVPDGLLNVGTWPSAMAVSARGPAGGPALRDANVRLKDDGFSANSLRVVLYPSAWRFFQLQMCAPSHQATPMRP